MARWGAVLFAAGATLGVLSLLLPHGPQTDEQVAAATAVLGYVVAAGLAVLGERTPAWVIHVALVAGVSAVAVGIHAAGTGRLAGSASVLYLWVAIFSAYYFSWTEATVYVVLVAISYALVLNIDHEPAWPALWAGMTGTCAATAVIVAKLSDRLRTLASTDALTGLPNRRGWEVALERELARTRRRGSPLCVALLDLDNFKALNDERGHLAGDRVLKTLASTWLGLLRDTDLLARYGGDEFAVVLPDCPPQKATEIVERLSTSNADESSCSVGVACAAPGDEAQDLIARADRALYEAKGRGGGRVALWRETA
ncbi:MAG: GGDEF domain-containing protein [Actinobacteria bacterium]|nr:MAG: GGDEF domain-containing protein [Actinomycetota bacterium]